MAEFFAILMVVVLVALLLQGYPVAFVLAGVSLWFALGGAAFDVFSLSYLSSLPGRIYGVMNNDLLVAVPLFVFMGVVLERAKIAEELLETMAALFGPMRGGLGISVLLVGALLAASTGIVGATVVTMGLISLPTMLKTGYSPRIATGTICAAGTLGQIIPPSVVLVLLGDQISNAWQTAQLKAGVVSPLPVSVSDLFVGSIVPGLLLVGFYLMWMIFNGIFFPEKVPPLPAENRDRIFEDGKFICICRVLLPPLLLIAVVLGSILGGYATPTEAASVGAVGALALAALKRRLSIKMLHDVSIATAKVSSMVFIILVGAAFFTLVFRGYGGEDLINEFFHAMPGGLFMAMLLTMVVVFFLGFILDFVEITFVVVPIVTPVLLAMGADPIWLAVMFAVNLQTSFLTPPFGFSLFYLRGVAPESVRTSDIYHGVIPYVAMQLLMLCFLAVYPALATRLPEMAYATKFMPIRANAETMDNNDKSPTYLIDF